MLMQAVAGVDHRALELAGQVVGGAAGIVADDQDIRLHGLQVVGRVRQGLAFDGAGGRHRQVEGVGAEAFGGDLEGHAGPGAGLVEHGHHRLAPQGGDLLDGPPGDLLEGGGGVQDEPDLFGGERGDAQEILVPEFHRPGPFYPAIGSLKIKITPVFAAVVILP